jgi:hypothetical protein
MIKFISYRLFHTTHVIFFTTNIGKKLASRMYFNWIIFDIDIDKYTVACRQYDSSDEGCVLGYSK